MQPATIAPAASDALSPELALVDPDAAELARRALPEITLFEDTLRPPESVRRRRRVLRAAALALALVVAGAAAVFSLEPDLRTQAADALPGSAPARPATSTPAAPVAPTRTAASTPAPAPRSVPVAKPKPKPKRTPTAPARTIPDFVWVAAPGATGYRVEFRRGTRLVYSTTTKEPRLHVPAARLPPGKYRWQVRRLDRARRATGAPLVDAAVSVG